MLYWYDAGENAYSVISFDMFFSNVVITYNNEDPMMPFNLTIDSSITTCALESYKGSFINYVDKTRYLGR